MHEVQNRQACWFSGRWRERRTCADEEILFLAVQCHPVRPGQSDAMTRGEGSDQAAPTLRSPFDEVSRVLPMHGQPLVDSPQNLRKSHHMQAAAPQPDTSPTIRLYCTDRHGDVPC